MTTRSPAGQISPEWTLGQLKESFPSVELALFAYFGVGSRERSGFSASESLGDLLRRHLVFDAEKACARLQGLATEDSQYAVEPPELRGRLGSDGPALLDARSAADHQRCRLAGSRLLCAQSVGELRQSPPSAVVVVCGDGSQSPAASRHLRGLGLNAFHLRGGLEEWSYRCDESFPIMYPLVETPGRWHLLADGLTLRFRRPAELPRRGEDWRIWSRAELQGHSELAQLADQLGDLQLVMVTPCSFALRGGPPDLHAVIAAADPWKDRLDLWFSGGEAPDAGRERALLERVLRDVAPNILQSHKGSVEVEQYQDRILTLRLGGGCAGCAGAQITTQRELAAALYREVPLLDSVVSVG